MKVISKQEAATVSGAAWKLVVVDVNKKTGAVFVKAPFTKVNVNGSNLTVKAPFTWVNVH
jgi:hypothetical protein